MTPRMVIGAAAFVAGAAIWFFTRRAALGATDTRAPAASLPRLGVAIGALGLSVLASSRPGLGWSISSICYSLVAILVLARVARDSLRR